MRRFKHHRHSHHRHQRHNGNGANPKFHRAFKATNYFFRKHPIITAIGSIIAGIILIRLSFSENLFGWANSEFRLWLIFAAVVMGLIGFLALIAWWRNNVATHNFKANVNWTNRRR